MVTHCSTFYVVFLVAYTAFDLNVQLRNSPILIHVTQLAFRLELDDLNYALQCDRLIAKGKKIKPRKAPKQKKKKKKGKKKGKKDPTANRKIEDLFQELIDAGIIRKYHEQHLEDYFGDFSYSNSDLRVQGYDPPQSLGDVRQVVLMNCILPLNIAEPIIRPRSVLITGPRQSGKHLLANAIFNDTHCVLFDISPPILAGKYKGKRASLVFKKSYKIVTTIF